MGSFLAYGGTLEPYLSQFDVEKLEMASVMGICAGLVEPKSENVEKVLVFKAFLKGGRIHRPWGCPGDALWEECMIDTWICTVGRI